MKQLHTEITINAPVETVWRILMDFDQYPRWNPFIRSVTGNVSEGERFVVVLQPPGGKSMTFRPVCLKRAENTEFRWLGHLLIPGIFDGEHIFELREIEAQTTLFIQRENFKGLLVPMFWQTLDTQTREAFRAMNQKLKELAEELS